MLFWSFPRIHLSMSLLVTDNWRRRVLSSMVRTGRTWRCTRPTGCGGSGTNVDVDVRVEPPVLVYLVRNLEWSTVE